MITTENMTEKIKTEIKKTNLVTLQLKQTSEGSTIFIKSQPFENFFKVNGTSSQYIVKPDGSKIQSYCYDLVENREDNKKLQSFESNLRSYDGTENFGFIRAKGIGEGLTINLSGVYSKEATNEYIKNFKVFMLKFYSLYMIPQNIELKIDIMESVK